MSTNETRPETLAEALSQLQGRLPVVEKDAVGDAGSYRYAYATLPQIVSKIMPLLSELGLSFSCRPTLTEDGKFVLEYELMHVSGESKLGRYPLPTNGSPQQLGSAISYGRRYCLSAVVGIAAEDDDDGRAGQPETASRGRTRKASSTAQADHEDRAQPTSAVPAGLMKRLQSSFTAAGIKERAERLAKVAEIVGRPVDSANDLTRAEASKVVDRLAIEAATAEAAKTQAQTSSGDA